MQMTRTMMAPPEYTTADEKYEGGEGEYDTPQGRPTIHGTETRNAGNLVEWGSNGDTEDHMEISSPAGQLVLREPDFWGESQHGYPQLFIGASQQTGSPGMVAFDLSNIPNF